MANLSAEKPHFSRCLEWLLFTVFDAEISRYIGSNLVMVAFLHYLCTELLDFILLCYLLKYYSVSYFLVAFFANCSQIASKNQLSQKNEPAKKSLLDKTCDLLRNFPEYMDVVVSVARKTDGRHWADLFHAAGRSTE